MIVVSSMVPSIEIVAVVVVIDVKRYRGSRWLSTIDAEANSSVLERLELFRSMHIKKLVEIAP